MTDTEIIDSLKNNKYSRAVKGLYGILPYISRYIKANSGTGDDAKDIFQDALVILYRKVQDGEFEQTGTLKGYLYSVSKNLWSQELRRRKRIPAGEFNSDIADSVSEDEPGAGAANAAFNLLGEKCRQLLVLFYFRKKTYREIAATLAFSDENVAKNQKYRCIQKAKENYFTLVNTVEHGK